MSKINLNLIDRPALFEMARYIRTVKDGRANEPRINGPLYFLSRFIIILSIGFILTGLRSNYGPVAMISFLIFICLFSLSLFLDFRRLNDIGVDKNLGNILVIINGFILLFSSLMVAFYDSKATYNLVNDGTPSSILILIMYIYRMVMWVFLNFTSTDSSYVKRICKGFYDDSQIAEAYRYVMSERGNILNFKEEIYSKDESNSYSSELREVKKLYDEGILTEEEFEKAKKKILDI